jgi:hypothetical protein
MIFACSLECRAQPKALQWFYDFSATAEITSPPVKRHTEICMSNVLCKIYKKRPMFVIQSEEHLIAGNNFNQTLMRASSIAI